MTQTTTMTAAEHTANILGRRPFLGTPSDDNEGTIHTLGRGEIARFRAECPDWDGDCWGYDRSHPDHPMIPVNIRD